MLYTGNYNLHKIELLDAPPDIEVLNPNWDIIDTELKKLSDNKADHTVYVANPDLNTLLEDKAYICAGTMKNAPIANTYCFVRVYDTGDTSRVLQICSVPSASNLVRTFVRAITGTSVFGAWQELGNTNYIDEQVALLKILVDENTFRNKALATAITRSLTTLFVETFTDTNGINYSAGDGATAITNYYKADKHIFEKTDEATVTIYSASNVVSSGNNNVWALVDWESNGGSVEFAVSRNGGTTYTTVPSNTLTNISALQSAGAVMIWRITMTGKLKLKNIAWGAKA
ncbi:MAG: hypothetical protein IKT32_01760 [Clostridia bacterium]|nr:hypothetical protein [Clostridia bacterium]